MARTLEFTAPAKINLYLKVLGRRPDGYHELDSVFARLDLADRLRLVFGAAGQDGLTARTAPPGGLPPGFSGPDNLVLKAVRAFRAATGWPETPVGLFLEKNIPWGAGLGGGSSDGAAALAALNRAAPRPLPEGELARLALGLGADLPFFISGAVMARAGGVGEKLSAPPAAFESFRGRRLLLIKPAFSLATAEVFARLGRTGPPEPLEGPPAPGENDLLAPALRLAPALAETLEAIRSWRPEAWGLSGSGPTFWLCGAGPAARDEAGRRGWWIAETAIAAETAVAN